MADPADITEAEDFLAIEDFPLVEKRRVGHNVTFRWEDKDRKSVVTITFYADHWDFEGMTNEPEGEGIMTLVANRIATAAIEHKIDELRVPRASPDGREALQSLGFQETGVGGGMATTPKALKKATSGKS